MFARKQLMIERDFYWINPQSVVIPKGKLQTKEKKRWKKKNEDKQIIL